MILKLGSGANAVDVSEYVENGYTVNAEPILQTNYTAVDGTENVTLLGMRYIISAELTNVPADTAAQILDKCGHGMSITFAFPQVITATFNCPRIRSTMVTEGDQSEATGEYWDIAIDAQSEPILNGL